MSASTRSRAPNVASLVLAAAFATLPLALAQVPEGTASMRVGGALPEAVRTLAPGLRVQGEGAFRWFGLAVYHARLWSPAGGWRADETFAIEIRYARSVKGHRLAETSVDEMRHTAAGSDAERRQWGESMRAIFPDVRDGDQLIGLSIPGTATRFFLNGQAVGDIADPGFGPAFFGIWLSPSTSRPDLRRMLLGSSR